MVSKFTLPLELLTVFNDIVCNCFFSGAAKIDIKCRTKDFEFFVCWRADMNDLVSYDSICFGGCYGCFFLHNNPDCY